MTAQIALIIGNDGLYNYNMIFVAKNIAGMYLIFGLIVDVL